MNIDPRGGHNRKSINVDFFKSWSPQMAYVLGLISADGAVEDVRNSSRTCYFTITNVDEPLILRVKKILNSSHKIYERPERLQKFSNGNFWCAKTFILRVGSKEMVQDLINLGVTPRKSLRLKLPKVPDKYFKFYLRGYFDGDGCVHISKPNKKRPSEIKLIFTSGCQKFLLSLNEKLNNLASIKNVSVYLNSRAYRLSYRKRNSLEILSFMYKDLNLSPYMARKYKIYQNYLNTTQMV